MNRRQYAPGSGVIVDVCRDHGIWFDDEELSQLMDWFGRGGSGEKHPSNQPLVAKPPARDRIEAANRDPAKANDVDFDIVDSVLTPFFVRVSTSMQGLGE
jgi:hypothetical protein